MPDDVHPARELPEATPAAAPTVPPIAAPLTAPPTEEQLTGAPASADLRTSEQPAELVSRGLAFALLAIPAGIVVWVMLWQFGFIAAIAAFGVAWLALVLYRRGSGGIVSRSGFWAVVSVTAVTLVLSFLAGMAWDMATFLELDLPGAFASSEFWYLFLYNVTDNPDLWAAYVPDILISLVLAVLGTFSVFRTLAKQTSGTPELGFR